MAEKKTSRDGGQPLSAPSEARRPTAEGGVATTPDQGAMLARLQDAVEAAQLGTWDLDLTTGASLRSRRHDQLFGHDAPQSRWDDATAEANLLPEDRPLLREAFAKARLTGHVSADLRVRWPDGAIHWISVVGRTFFDAAGRPVRMTGIVSDITERRRAELTLVEAGQQLELAQALGGMGVFEHDIPTGNATWSEEQFRIYGVSAEEFSVTQQAWRGLVLPDDLAKVEALFAEAVSRRGQRLNTAFRIRRPTGEIRTVSSLLSITYAADGTPLRATGVNVDVTDRLRALEAARQSDERFRAMAQATREGIVIHDGQVTLAVNDALLRMFGYDRREEVTGRGVLDFIAPEWREAARARGRSRYPDPYEVQGLRRDGTVFPAELQSRDLVYLGRPARVTIVRDLTAQRRAESALRESEERLRLAQEAAGVGLWDYDLRTGVSVCSEMYCRIYGLDPDSRGHRSFDDWLSQVHPEDRERVGAAATAAFADGVYDCEYRILRKDGVMRWIAARGTTQYDEKGTPERFLGLLIDITALRESELRMRLAIEGAGFATWDRDAVSGNAVWSLNHFPLFGYPTDPQGRTSFSMWRDRIHPEDLPAIEEALACAGGNEPFRFTYRIRRADDGAERWMESAGRGIGQSPGGRPTRMIGITMDVTERMRMESDMRQGQKLQALGELAGGIAHDFNNVLQAVMGGMRLMEKHTTDPSALKRYAGQIMSSVERGAAITQRLLLLARRSDLTPQAVPVAALFEELATVLGPTLGPNVTVRTEMPPGLPAVLADKAQLETALINLATNARDAMPGGGAVTISAAAEPQSLGGGPWIRISVRDLGEGMDAATLARATEPFFSTKPPGKGTGLGVPMAKGFAEQSGGHFALESEPGRGTTVMLWLPQAPTDDEVQTPAPPPPPAGEQLPLRLLLVDDDAAVLATLSAELAAGGSTVLTAESGEEAIERLERGAPVDALVTDLSMPGMDGLTVIREARGRLPGLPAVLLTGYPGDPAQLLAAGRESGPFALLSKPSTGDRVAEALAAIAQGRGRQS